MTANAKQITSKTALQMLAIAVVAMSIGACAPHDSAPSSLDAASANSNQPATQGSAAQPQANEPLADSAPLQVVLGQGADGFSLIPEGVLPQAWQGPQGGQHVYFGVEITSPTLEQADALTVRFEMIHHPDTATCEDRQLGTTHGGCDVVLASRTINLGGQYAMDVADGKVVQHGILTPIFDLPTGVWTVAVHVEDSLGRTGSDVRHVLVAGRITVNK